MKVDQFDFDLPSALIATRPARPRDSARLLVGKSQLLDHHVHELPNFLRAGDIMVFNDAKVLPAQLTARRLTVRDGTPPDAAEATAWIELNLHQAAGDGAWRAFARPAKKLRAGDELLLGEGFTARVRWRNGAEVLLDFNCQGEQFAAALARHGVMPLPPYIRKQRPVDSQDADDYQTVYGQREGAVAAPTAGLHFTEDLLQRITQAGVHGIHLTLFVGAGTFLPVKAEDTDDHIMHSEYGEISEDAAAAINQARAAGGRIIAVGTTSLRLLESASTDDGIVRPFAGNTDIFITPGYRFKATDILLTNFHLPRSTLFMLVAAFAGLEHMRSLYAHAIARRYRFYSYGDASLLYLQTPTSAATA